MTPLMIGVGVIAAVGLISVANLVHNFDEAHETKRYIKTAEEIEYLSKKSEVLKNNNKYNTINNNTDIVKYGKISDIIINENSTEKEIIALNKLNETIKNYIKNNNPLSDLNIDYTNQNEIDNLWIKLSKNNFEYTKLSEEEFNLAIKSKFSFYEVNEYNIDISDINNSLKISKLNEKIVHDTDFPIYNEDNNLSNLIKVSKSYLNNNEVGNKSVFKKNKKINSLVSKINAIINENNSGYNEYMKAFRLNIQLSRIDPIYSKKLNLILNQKMLNSKNLRTEEKVILSKLNEKNVALNEKTLTENMSNNLKVAYIKDNFSSYNEQNIVNNEEIEKVIVEKNDEELNKLIVNNPEYNEYIKQIEEEKLNWETEIQENSIENELVNVKIEDTIEVPVVSSSVGTTTTVQVVDTQRMISTFTLGNGDIEVVEDTTTTNTGTNAPVVEEFTATIVDIKNF